MSALREVGRGGWKGGSDPVRLGRTLALALVAASALASMPAHAPAAPVAVGTPEPPSWPSCPGCNLLLISIDTLRADRLGCYGSNRGASPELDALARRGLVFERAYSTSYVTADSHMSVFTSLYPSVHGVRNALPHERSALRLSEGIPTLAQVLRNQGYATAAVTGGGNISDLYGFDRGMDSYESPTDADVALERALKLIGQKRSAPFFVFFHTYHTHDPYTPSEAEARRFAGGYRGRIEHDRARLARLRVDESFADARRAFWSLVDKGDPADVAHLLALYDAEVHEVDRSLGRLLRQVRRTAPNTLVVVMSDHGEQFGEHGGFLHNDLYEELVRVPLVVAHPSGRATGRVSSRVSLLDLAPSVLDMLEVGAPAAFQGRSLRGVVRGSEPPRPVFAEKAGRRAMLIRGDEKLLVWTHEDGTVRRHERFDLATDPGERRALARPRTGEDLVQLSRLVEANRALAAGRTTTEQPAQPIGAGTLESLRALGYVQ